MEILSCVRLRRTYLAIGIVLIIINTALSEILPSILWSTDNPFFGNLGGKARTVFFKDKINFVCPNTVQYTVKKSTPMNKENLYANIYMVDKQGYDNCNSTGGLEITLCDTPTELKSASLLINDIAPSQGIPIFYKGKTNYFIDTSSGTENTINNRTGGQCKTHNMKMKIYVCTDPSDPECPSGNRVENGGWSLWQECKSGRQRRKCNNPHPANGGFTCEGNSTQSCMLEMKPTTEASNNGSHNNTFKPMKGNRTSVADTLGTLSVGAVVVIFLTIFIFGCVLGLIVGVHGTHKKLKHFVVKRRPARPNNNFNRSSIASTKNLRPASFASILSTSTGITNFDNSVNDTVTIEPVYELNESELI